LLEYLTSKFRKIYSKIENIYIYLLFIIFTYFCLHTVHTYTYRVSQKDQDIWISRTYRFYRSVLEKKSSSQNLVLFYCTFFSALSINFYTFSVSFSTSLLYFFWLYFLHIYKKWTWPAFIYWRTAYPSMLNNFKK